MENGILRQMCSDFVVLKIQARDDACLVWLLQRVVIGLTLIGVDPDLIRERVSVMLPPQRDGEEG